jgi:hypothetical protein
VFQGNSVVFNVPRPDRARPRAKPQSLFASQPLATAVWQSELTYTDDRTANLGSRRYGGSAWTRDAAEVLFVMFNFARWHRSRYGTSLRLNARTLWLLAGLAINGTPLAAQQTSPTNPRSKGEIVIIHPFNLTYPPLARQANITGDVELKLEIRKDGSLQSAAVVSGHRMLAPAALNSAQRSNFECRGCEEPVTLGSVTYSFQIAASPGWPCPETNGARVTQSGNHMIVTAEPTLVRPYFSYTAARSAKCFYLWACGRRWGGEDYYFYPVRSAKCLGLWNCGHQLREPFATCKELNRKLSY